MTESQKFAKKFEAATSVMNEAREKYNETVRDRDAKVRAFRKDLDVAVNKAYGDYDVATRDHYNLSAIGLAHKGECPVCKKQDWRVVWGGTVRTCVCGHKQWQFKCWTHNTWSDKPPTDMTAMGYGSGPNGRILEKHGVYLKKEYYDAPKTVQA